MAYAQSLGFAPHPDYKKACRVLGGLHAKDCPTEFTYGKEGKPLFISGPDDSEEKCRRMLKLLDLKCGQNNLHFLIGGQVATLMDAAQAPAENEAVAADTQEQQSIEYCRSGARTGCPLEPCEHR